MFVRKKKNTSGSLSVQVIQKIKGKNKVIKTVGSATTQQKVDELVLLAKTRDKKDRKSTEIVCFRERYRSRFAL